MERYQANGDGWSIDVYRKWDPPYPQCHVDVSFEHRKEEVTGYLAERLFAFGKSCLAASEAMSIPETNTATILADKE